MTDAHARPEIVPRVFGVQGALAPENWAEFRVGIWESSPPKTHLSDSAGARQAYALITLESQDSPFAPDTMLRNQMLFLALRQVENSGVSTRK